jgi:dihydroxy-acid dehydratase
VKDGDGILIDIPNRIIRLEVTDAEFAARRKAEEARGAQAFTPVQPRERKVSRALKAYALLASSADEGAVRKLPGE